MVLVQRRIGKGPRFWRNENISRLEQPLPRPIDHHETLPGNERCGRGVMRPRGNGRMPRDDAEAAPSDDIPNVMGIDGRNTTTAYRGVIEDAGMLGLSKSWEGAGGSETPNPLKNPHGLFGEKKAGGLAASEKAFH